MTTQTAHDATATHYCKYPGCTNEARSPVGRYSYCREHQGKLNSSTPQPRAASAGVGVEKNLRDLISLAKRVDKALAKADAAESKAAAARRDAVRLDGEYRAALAEASAGGSS